MSNNRCGWVNTAPDYIAYHDQEWGREIRDDRLLFERLSLEAFQSGLSWLTVLRKRENFRKAFLDFEPEKVAAFSEAKVADLLTDAGIIRHRGKIEATIKNAQAICALWDKHGEAWLSETLQNAAPNDTALVAQGFKRPPNQLSDLPASCLETIELSKYLKQMGFVRLGPITLYAALQATGFVKDHLTECFLFES